MKRNVPNHIHRDEKLRLPRNGNYEAGLQRTEEERLLSRRREWMIEQEKLREHERLKEKKILEYEIRRALEKGLPLSRRRFSYHSRSKSKSKSKSMENRHGTVTSNTSILSKKLEPSDGTKPLFKGPEGTQVSVAELRRIKVGIHRNVPGKATTDDLQRDIINPEDVLVKRREGIHQQSKGPEGTQVSAAELRRIKVGIHRNVSDKATTDDLQRDIINPEDVLVKRRKGEGSKPIFEREEIKGTTVKTKEIVEHRTVVALNNEYLENESKVNKKYTTSSRNRSHSPQHRSPRHARYEDSKHYNRDSYRSDSERNHSRDRSREYKETIGRHSQLNTAEEKHLRERRSHRDRSRSKEREQRAWVRDSHHRSYKGKRSYRGRSRERSRERRERDRSREHSIPLSHYIEQIPVPIYYGNFPPRPIIVGPLVPIRGQVPPLGGTRHIMDPLRTFSPQFIPPDMYRLRPPPNPGFRPMY